MRYSRTLCLLVALALPPASLHAASSAVTRERAEATALRLVPGGTVVIGDLEQENGRLVWLLDISIPGSRNLREIQVDARTGAVVSNTLETPTDR
jgi:uncharacterized membrane protein YkoI